MHNLFDLYQQYLATKDKSLLGDIVTSDYVYTVIDKAKKANTDYKRQQQYLEPEEIISFLYIRLDKHLHQKHFNVEAGLKTYIKKTVLGIIMDAATRDSFNKNTIVTDNIADYARAITDDLGLVHYPEAEAYIKQHPFLYDYCFLHKSIRDIMKEQKIGYKTIKQHIEHLKTLLD